MSKIEWIIESINANMMMEDMPLKSDDIIRIRKCLEEKNLFDSEIKTLIKKHGRSERA